MKNTAMAIPIKMAGMTNFIGLELELLGNCLFVV